MNSGEKKRKGFTLIELLIVVAMIGVLSAAAIPVYNDQIERARNAVDMYNARTAANAIVYYFMDNPNALAELTAECDKTGSAHLVQASFGAEGPSNTVGSNTNTAIAKVLLPALHEAGLIGPYDENQRRFTDIVCMSRENWKGYRIVVTNYSGKQGQPGDLKIYFWGVAKNKNVHATEYLSTYQNGTDPTGFRDRMSGR